MRFLITLAAAFACSAGVLADTGLRDDLSAEIRKIIEKTGGKGDASLSADLFRSIDPEAEILDADAAEQLKTVNGVGQLEQWPRGIIYLKAESVSAGIHDALLPVLKASANSALSGLILDLRGAGGWNVREAERLASLFLRNGTPICRIMTENGIRRMGLQARGPERAAAGLTTVILVDKETRGMAEMLAGTLSGRENILVMGTKTSGSSSLRKLISLDDDKYLFLKTGWADWGRGVKKSVAPDVLVEAKNIKPENIVPARAGAESEALVELIRVTAEDELIRRASDLLLARLRVMRRKVDVGKNH